MPKRKKTKAKKTVRRKNKPKSTAVSQSEFARLMNQKYGTDYSRASISIAVKAGMPGARRNNSIVVEKAEPWWQENRTKIFANGKTLDTKLLSAAQTAAAEIKLENARRAKMENDVYERKQLGGWIEIAKVEQFLETLGVKDGQDLDALLEEKTGLLMTVWNVVKKYVTLDDPVKMLDEIHQELKKTNDQLKERFRQRAKEAVK